MNAAVALVALLVERAVGYPQGIVGRIGHPVIWFGSLIGWLDRSLNRPHWSSAARRAAGVVALLIVLAVVGAITAALLPLRALPFGWLLEALLATTLLAQKGLRDAVAAVATALERDGVPAARVAVSHIVGRDTAALETDEISRAAIETLAENTSDGIVAPLFWLLLLGLPGLALYKAINTADSMIGHRSERHHAFGWAAARLDDLVNLVPARLTALLFAAAARALPGAHPGAALRTALRDARRHASPNAGWPESALAGALGFGLGGPRTYAGQMLDLPAMGSGRRDLGAADIRMSVALYDRLLWLTWALVALLAVGLYAL